MKQHRLVRSVFIPQLFSSVLSSLNLIFSVYNVSLCLGEIMREHILLCYFGCLKFLLWIGIVRGRNQDPF
jgi:hypothetical protein